MMILTIYQSAYGYQATAVDGGAAVSQSFTSQEEARAWLCQQAFAEKEFTILTTVSDELHEKAMKALKEDADAVQRHP